MLYTRALAILGAFLAIMGSILLLFFGSGWADITRLGLQEKLIPPVVLSFVCLFSGLFMVASQHGPREIRDFLNKLSEGGSPLWSHILGVLVIVLFFFIGYSSDPRAYFFILVIAVAMINDVKKLGLEVGGQRWKILGKYLYLGVIVVGTAYVAFENVVHALLGLCGFLAGAGFVLFTPYGKAIKKYTVFQERNVALLVIIVSIVAILFTQLL